MEYRRVIFFWTFPVFAANVPAMMMKNIRGPDDIAVRPVLDPAERDRWDETMRKHHYLQFRGMVGEAVRHVAVAPNGEWVALLGWKAGAWRLRAREGRLDARAARPTVASCGEQRALADSSALAATQLGVPYFIPQHPALVGRLSGGIRPSSLDGGDFCRSGPFRGNVLPGSELASRWVHKRVRTRAAVTANMERPERF